MTHDHYSITIGSDTLPILVRKRRGARRMVIRYQPLKHAVSLTLPATTSIRQGLRFAEDKRGWIERRIAAAPAAVPFSEGQVLSVLGKHYTLCHEGGRGVVRVEGERIIVPGDSAFMPRRVREWLKVQLKVEITRLAARDAARLGVYLKKISLRDTSSRWGSCSVDGNLSFSWRLVFAPYEVLEYLVSHEVAHVKEHNHSAAFWALVAHLCPGHAKAERWLKAYGPTLYAYG